MLTGAVEGGKDALAVGFPGFGPGKLQVGGAFKTPLAVRADLLQGAGAVVDLHVTVYLSPRPFALVFEGAVGVIITLLALALAVLVVGELVGRLAAGVVQFIGPHPVGFLPVAFFPQAAVLKKEAGGTVGNALLVGDFVFDVAAGVVARSEEHTSELQSRPHLVCRLLLEKKK